MVLFEFLGPSWGYVSVHYSTSAKLKLVLNHFNLNKTSNQ